MARSVLEEVSEMVNLAHAFRDEAKKRPNDIVYYQAVIDKGNDSPEQPRAWVSEDYASVSKKVWRLANYLIAQGVKRGDSVAIIAYTRPEWMIADLAILAAGGISVSVYQSLSEDVTGYILFDSDCKFVIAENKQQVDKLLVLSKEPCAIPEVEDRPARDVQLAFKRIIAIEAVEADPLVVQYEDIISDETLAETPPAVIDSISSEDVASFVYTSGTTGPPKGVVQTHKNHLANVKQAHKTNLFNPNGSIFLFLPLAHSFAKLVGYLGFLLETKIKFPAVADRKTSVLNATSVLRDMREGSAECVPSVPRILEKLLAGVKQKATEGGLGSKILSAALSSADQKFRAEQQGIDLAWSVKLTYALTTPIRKKVVKKLFGPSFQHCVSGGAKLPEKVAEFFWSIGVPIYEGYGLTETCVATNVNPKGGNKIGSVGPALEAIEMKIADDGEILFKGPNITSGYHNRPEATKGSYGENGWFHTGDLGSIDKDGYLFIVGRKKDIIVTAGGKNIAPNPIEEKLAFSPYVSHALVYGDAKPYCIGVVTLEEGPVMKALGISSAEYLHKNPQAIKLIQKEVEEVNKTLSKYETLKRFVILPGAFTVENEYLTPSFKLKKKKIFEDFKDDIEAVYEVPR